MTLSRLFLVLTFMLLSCGTALAQAGTPPQNGDAPAEPQEKPQPAAGASAPDAAGPATDYAALESKGILYNPADGALGKSLWDGQKRSDILKLLADMPLRTEMRSITTLKKNLLLSETDASLIVNDVAPEPGQDLLTLRLQKLMDSGFYKEAYTLYTDSVEEPYEEALARTGIQLILSNTDLATACLEEKILAPRFPGVAFWDQIDAICDQEINGTPVGNALKDNPALNAIFTNPAYRVSAADHSALLNMDRTERAMLVAQGRIDYAALTANPGLGTQADPSLLMLYLQDPLLPEPLVLPLQREAVARGLLAPGALKKSDPDYKRIDIIESPQEQAQALQALLAGESHISTLIPYIGMMKDNENMVFEPASARRAASLFLVAGQDVPDPVAEALLAGATETPENYVYLQLLNLLYRTNTLNPKFANIPVDKLELGFEAMDIKKSAQLIAIIEILDKDKKLADNLAEAYEKHRGLTLGSYYVMPSSGLIEWMKTAKAERRTGIVVLILTSMFHDLSGAIHPEALGESVKSLEAVGLLESANRIIEDVLVSAMNDKI